MKSRIKKISSILAISSCLLFTACGEEETIAPIEESTTESTMESTMEVVEESETESVVESDIENETNTEVTVAVDSVGHDATLDEGDYVEPPLESTGQRTPDQALDRLTKMFEAGLMSEADYKMMVEEIEKLKAEEENQPSNPGIVVGDAPTLGVMGDKSDEYEGIDNVDLPDYLKGDVMH